MLTVTGENRETRSLILASASETRHRLLLNSGVPHKVVPSNIDENHIKLTLQAKKATAEEIAGAIAAAKAKSVSDIIPEKLVLGVDQVLECEGIIFNKPDDLVYAMEQLLALRGKKHRLISYAVVMFQSRCLWRGWDTASLTIRKDVSDGFLSKYLKRVGKEACNGPGGYKIESVGLQLFSHVQGDHFTILGIPLLKILCFLRSRGFLET